ncbi:MAG: PleD family two-component system response regulator [Alphaproteobacteria bacterium]
MPARVLIVDDVPVNLKVLEAKLSQHYYEVMKAPDGPSALKCVQDESPDIVLLDVMMPGMDGYEVCRRIKADPKSTHIPVVMVTSLTEQSERVLGLEAGADDFLSKPINDAALIARVRSLVRLKQMMDEWRLRSRTGAQLGLIELQDVLADGPGRILLVESNALLANKVVEALTPLGHSVSVASDTTAGFEQLRTGDFDAVFVGCRKDVTDSFRFCGQVRSHEASRAIPIVLIMEQQDVAAVGRALELGVTDYIVRPVDPNELRARTRSQIRRKRYQDRLREDFDRSLSMAFTDSLTGIYNRRYLMAHLGTLLGKCQSDSQTLAALMVDIDHFKAVNDSRGHAAGDAVLREIANRLSGRVRGSDLVARLGGEEFVVVLPSAEAASASAVAERIRETAAATPIEIPGEQPIAVTLSIGIAVSEPADSVDALLRRSDEALYAAKAGGRNRVIMAGPALVGLPRAAAG